MQNLDLSPSEIAVIIVTYQSAKHIKACLRSLTKADPFRHVTIILIDNASTDGTQKIVKRVRPSCVNSHLSLKFLFNKNNLGFTRAINQGLELCPKDTMVLFLNPDTILPISSLACLVQKLYAIPDCGIVVPQMLFPPSSKDIEYKPNSLFKNIVDDNFETELIQPSCRCFPVYRDLLFELTGLSRLFPKSSVFNHWKMGDFDHCSAREVEQPQGACLLVRPEVVKQVGLWDERFPIFFSDVDWCLRVWQAGWKIRFEPDIQIFHSLGESV